MCNRFRCELHLHVSEVLCSKKTILVLTIGIIVCLIIISFKLSEFGTLYNSDVTRSENLSEIVNTTTVNNTEPITNSSEPVDKPTTELPDWNPTRWT